MPANAKYDLIVIGGGSIGLSTAFHAAKRGMKTAIFEQFGFLNDQGSSAGWSRQFRLQYAVQYMSELCLASLPFWADLQKYTGAPLIGKDGSLWFGDPKLDTREGGIEPAEKVMDALGIKYTKLDAQQIQSKYHFRNIDPTYRGFFQAQGGAIDLKAAQQGLFYGCIDAGVDLHPHVQVAGIDSQPGGDIVLTTRIGDFTTGKLAVTAGAWSNNLTVALGCLAPIIIWEMCSAYFKMIDPRIPYETWFYYGGKKNGKGNDFYGFPVESMQTGPWLHPGYIRVAPDFPDWVLTDPSGRRGWPKPENIRLTEQFVAEHMTGIHPKAEFATTCLAPLAHSTDPNIELLIDHPPAYVHNNKQIVVYTGGWAAKFVPILGDMICQMLTDPNLSAFNYKPYSIPVKNFAIAWNEELPQRRRIR
jgi:hypothetical protein